MNTQIWLICTHSVCFMVPLEVFSFFRGGTNNDNIVAYAHRRPQGKCLHLPFSMSILWEIFKLNLLKKLCSYEDLWYKSRSSCAAQCQTCFWHPPAKGKRDPSNILARQCPLKHCAGFSGVLNLLVDTSISQKLAQTHVLCDVLWYIIWHLTLKVLNGGVIFQHQLHVKPH